MTAESGDQISSSPHIHILGCSAEYRTQDVQPPTSSVYITLAHGMIKTVAIAVTPRLRFLEVVPGTPGYKSYALCEKHTSDEVLSDFAQAAHDTRRMGWLLQVPSVARATLITLVHPTHWYKYYTEHLFSQTQTFEIFSSIDDLLCRALANFSTRVLTGYCRDQGNVGESVYAHEFSCAVHDLIGPGYAKEECVTSNRDGFVDMQIKSKRWLFEFLVEGNNSIEHVEWFLPNGVYNNSWPHYKWRVIDFRMCVDPHVLTLRNCPSYHTVKFDVQHHHQGQPVIMEATVQWQENQFIDLEAQVNTDDEFSSDDENGDRDDFLDDAEEVESLLPKQKSFALPEQRPRADALFQHIEMKDDHPLIIHVLHSSQTNNWPTWSLKCWDPYPVLYELQRCHERLKPQLRSAYMNPGSPGAGAILEYLHVNPDVCTPDELRKTLTVPQSPNTINFIPGQWVQVKRGLYRGDVGCVARV
ncbi:hypothetical protein BT96DRAFT_997601 [Gymnopus androsaceus JB14]|uniref:Uncharacterized protein n=1 Tax=Gymnopus androsaceus JB14 TaxID=1447944 RepID=A0A6A4HCP2_9AGAR|nr:hypothetical protein BT96DRAFT_997601 [Gymnopus androsaceus JB14]